jgi:hypothetical protein
LQLILSETIKIFTWDAISLYPFPHIAKDLAIVALIGCCNTLSKENAAVRPMRIVVYVAKS